MKSDEIPKETNMSLAELAQMTADTYQKGQESVRRIIPSCIKHINWLQQQIAQEKTLEKAKLLEQLQEYINCLISNIQRDSEIEKISPQISEIITAANQYIHQHLRQ